MPPRERQVVFPLHRALRDSEDFAPETGNLVDSERGPGKPPRRQQRPRRSRTFHLVAQPGKRQIRRLRSIRRSRLPVRGSSAEETGKRGNILTPFLDWKQDLLFFFCSEPDFQTLDLNCRIRPFPAAECGQVTVIPVLRIRVLGHTQAKRRAPKRRRQAERRQPFSQAQEARGRQRMPPAEAAVLPLFERKQRFQAKKKRQRRSAPP